LFDSTTGDGVLRWVSASDGYDFTVTFTNWVVTDKTPIEETNLYASDNTTPLGIKTTWTEWILLQLGAFTYHASNLFGLLGDTYLYWLGLLLMTLLIRTLGWPVYAKSNDMTIKMQMAQPELNRIQEKYKGRADQASQQRMQMETMEVYKRYKINLWGCLMPLIQMPIFIAMYSVVQRFPLTPETTFGGVNGIMNTDFLWTNLGNTEMLANLPLALVVGGTMFLSQWLMQRRQAAAQKNNRAPQSAQAKQTAKTMKFMMYFMVVMMAYIAIGNAGIAFYWIIGNCYQLLQSEINHRQMKAKKAKLAARM
ncbi:MAG: YidC/Oxa1 family membrane protein insertase, partial [Candidatus Izemoplasmatales bacterium]|nr:YidC/Oxa1 family membrane protein insertase [Candidatus Izemoplasmatales bacterium]